MSIDSRRLLVLISVAILLWIQPLRAQTCDDFNVCTNPDMCANGLCTGTSVSGSCNDNDVCTTNDTCVDGICHGTPASSGACDDHNPCTTNDTCVSGTCQGTPVENGAACGDAGCEGTCTVVAELAFCIPDEQKQGDTCTPASGIDACDAPQCLGFTCFPLPKTCDVDANKCTIEICNPAEPSTCFAPIAIDCGDCATCNSGTGLCQPGNDGGSCDDGNVCTGNGTCADGACGLAAPVTPGAETPTNTPETPTDTPTVGVGTPTDTPLAPTDTPTAAPTDTPTEGVTTTPTDTPTEGPTNTPTETGGIPTDTPTEGATLTPTDTPIEAATDTPTEGPSETPTFTPTGIPTGTATATATETATGIPTGTATATATASATGTVTATANATATATVTRLATATATVTNTQPTLTPTATRTATPTNTSLPIHASIIVGSATGEPSSTVSIDVSLETDVVVAGTQNDITFTPDASIPADENGHPRCTVNPDIHKTGTAFSYQPAGCTVGTDCTSVRAIVLALDNLDPIPDGSTIYSCDVEIGADATGTYPLTCSNPGAGDPDGVRIGADCTDGTITVAVPSVATIVVGSAVGSAGDDVPLTVSLQTGVIVAGTQNDLTFGPEAGVVAGSNGRPVCAANPAIGKEGSAFSFQPAGCTVGTSCTGVRALILSLSNVDPIPNGSDLYTCTVAIAEGTTNGTYDVTCSNPGASDPEGVALPTSCINGDIVVGVQPTPTFTPTPTQVTPPAGTPTATPTVTATATVTFTATGTARPTAGGNDDDGCQVAGPVYTGSAWMLLAPLALLLGARRRRG